MLNCGSRLSAVEFLLVANQYAQQSPGSSAIRFARPATQRAIILLNQKVGCLVSFVSFSGFSSGFLLPGEPQIIRLTPIRGSHNQTNEDICENFACDR
jgi:hypothetical protein